jgi:hypothetical protein
MTEDEAISILEEEHVSVSDWHTRVVIRRKTERLSQICMRRSRL